MGSFEHSQALDVAALSYTACETNVPYRIERARRVVEQESVEPRHAPWHSSMQPACSYLASHGEGIQRCERAREPAAAGAELLAPKLIAAS